MTKRRLLRGGSYYFGPRLLRTASRYRDGPEVRNWNCGFRIVVSRRKP